MADLIGRIQDALASRYRVERELGRGGMATVFLAEDLRHRRQVAIKVLDPEIAAAIGPERFLREIATVAKLTHPHILPLHDSGVAEGLLFFVMPYVAGESLRERLTREKQLPVDEALRIAREMADALGYAHAQGLVHRDIKPENILLESGHAVVADFGVARAVSAADSEKLTATGIAVGTPAYMSPEQAAGGRDLDGRSDLYSLGCVLYEMLAGQPPFTGPTAESAIHQHLNVAPRPVTELRPAVSAGVAKALTRALAKTPADRYANTAAFTAALEREEPAEAPRRRVARWAAPAVALTAVLLTALAAWQSWWPFAGHPGPPPAKKDWILVAEFDSAPEDSNVAMASHDLLSAALDQSRMVATVSPDQVQQALRSAGKPENARVDAKLARELAYRSAVRAVLEGKVRRLGPAYSIVVQLVDADSGRVILTESAAAQNADALVPSLGNLAKKLRAGLGENRAAIRATRDMDLAMTPSFEAYQLYVRAQRVSGKRGANRQSLDLYRAAIALDPDFAAAWWGMSAIYDGLWFPDSAWRCLEEALKRPQRLMALDRQELQAIRADRLGDRKAALTFWDQMLTEDPNSIDGLFGSSGLLIEMGRFEESLERYRKRIKQLPFGPREGTWVGLAWRLMWLGRFDEAREACAHEQGRWRAEQGAVIEMSAGHWAAAESIATVHMDDADAADRKST